MAKAAIKTEELQSEWRPIEYLPRISTFAGLLVVALFGLFLYMQKDSIATETEIRLEYFARSVEQRSSSLLDTASSDLNALAVTLDLIEVGGNPLDARNVTPMLAAWTGDRPWIRSVSVLSTSGEVLFGSIASDVGQSANLPLLGKLPAPEQKTQQGPVLMGRGIADLKALDSDNSKGSPLLTFLRSRVLASGANVYMVVLINLDYFSNSFDLLLSRSGTQVAMLNYGGVVMAGTSDIGPTPGQISVPTPIFTEFLPAREMGIYQGLSIHGREVKHAVPAMIAFRAMRNWPTIIVVQRPTSLLTTQLVENLWPALGASISILVLIAALTQLALRSYRRRSQLREELQRQAAQTTAAVVRDTAIQNSSLDAIIIIDANDQILSFNPAAETIFGYAASDAIGRSMSEILVPPGLRQAHRKGLNRFLETRRGSVLNSRRETLGQRADGSQFAMEIGIVSIEVPSGFHFIGTVRDITLLKDEQAKSIDLMFELDLAAKELASKNVILEQSTRRELEIAQHIQTSILVSQPTQADPRVWISAYNQASKGVDGDFFEILTVGKNCFDLVAGDVMGKGVPAALLGAATKLQFSRSLVALLMSDDKQTRLPEPHEIISHVSQSIAPNLQSLNAFVTLVYIRINFNNDTLTWVGCGHEESSLLKHSGTTHLLSNQHPPLGILLDEVFEQGEFPFQAGDSLFISSDGASDAVDLHGRRIGHDLINHTVERLLEIHHTPSMTLHTLRRNILTQDVTLQDDLTLLMLTRPLHSNSARLEIPVALESLLSVRLFVEKLTETAGLAEDCSALIVVSAAEVLTNAIRHATGLLQGAPMEIVGEIGADQLVIEFRYIGDYFDPPADLPETDFGDFPEGGFGLHIIRQATDSVEYLHANGVNTIRMSIHLKNTQF